ncbi:four-carbon acid sugar kinase family protein [bacterium]|nr:four-carbon acid sugar kinase family protein [bacterium]
MITSPSIGIIADDLTGANDTALQFHVAGVNTRIILNPNEKFSSCEDVKAWAIPTETRNISPELAYVKIKEVAQFMRDKLDIDYFYKKIDSTLRGNIAVEALGMLQVLELDAAIIMPAFPNENRVTVGGYHLSKGVPIEKTEMASDPHSPIYDSHIPTILQKQIGNEYEHLIGSIELKTVLKGAGPVLNRLNELVEDGKKLIVVDAVSITDIEQVILALGKCNYKILPCGSAGAAQVIAKTLFPDAKKQTVQKTFSNLPKLVIAGSATELCANQIKKLIDSDEIENTYSVSLTEEDFINGITPEVFERIKSRLNPNTVVIIHSSDICQNEELQALLIEHELTKKQFASKIVDLLAELTKKLGEEKDFILVTVGGETSYECCKQLGCEFLNITDEVAPAIPLCIDNNSRFIVTKSGNLGNINTLVEILKYIKRHE